MRPNKSTAYNATAVDLTSTQRKRLLRQIKTGKTPSVRLSGSQLKSGKGGVRLPLTKMQQSRIRKAKTTGKGLNLKFSDTQVKKGGFLPALLLPALAALGATAGGAAGIAKAVNDAKVNKRQLEEQKRHNAMMEAVAMRRSGAGFKKKSPRGRPKRSGRGFFLRPASR